MSRDFEDFLATWQGFTPIFGRLERSGFNAHAAYLRYLEDRTTTDKSEIVRYWEEIAREYIASAGRTVRRPFREQPRPTYRSQYLDDLDDAFRRSGGVPDRWFGDFHPALFKLASLQGSSLLEERRVRGQVLENAKAGEIERFGSSLAPVDNLGEALLSALAHGASSNGFEACNLGAFQPSLQKAGYRKIVGGVEFCVGIDKDGLKAMRKSAWPEPMPLEFWVINHADRNEALYCARMQVVAPFMAPYASICDVRAVGISCAAMIAAFDAFSSSFG